MIKKPRHSMECKESVWFFCQQEKENNQKHQEKLKDV